MSLVKVCWTLRKCNARDREEMLASDMAILGPATCRRLEAGLYVCKGSHEI